MSTNKLQKKGYQKNLSLNENSLDLFVGFC